ncbi:hypothetical protein ACFYXC_38475 [Streptomyces sp. NPDC002701]|uniref:hypothetical protein n=1 Tax=Streptomyces sp. NPDC002701 TaxID=3364661 RepID=UPI0036C2AA8E
MVASLDCLTEHHRDRPPRPDRDSALGPDAKIPQQLPGVPLIRLAHNADSSLIHRNRSREYGSSTVQLSWAMPFDETTATTLLAYTVRLIAI